jgi:DNA-binding phage protein
MNATDFYSLLAEAVTRMVDDGITVKSISEQTSLSASTIYKFMRQDTKHPQLRTAWAVLEYLGYEVTVTKKGKKHELRSKHVTHQPTSTRVL